MTHVIPPKGIEDLVLAESGTYHDGVTHVIPPKGIEDVGLRVPYVFFLWDVTHVIPPKGIEDCYRDLTHVALHEL